MNSIKKYLMDRREKQQAKKDKKYVEYWKPIIVENEFKRNLLRQMRNDYKIIDEYIKKSYSDDSEYNWDILQILSKFKLSKDFIEISEYHPFDLQYFTDHGYKILSISDKRVLFQKQELNNEH